MIEGPTGDPGHQGPLGPPGPCFIGTFDDWLTFQYGDKSFEVEVVDAIELLAEVDRLHRDDALQCPVCGLSVGFAAISTTTAKPLTCGCTPKGSAFVLNPGLLRTLAERMKKHFAMERVSLNAAREFRSTVIQRSEDAKKKREARPESPTGTELIPEAGQI